MLSGLTIAGMFIVITICFFTPGALIFWLMMKRKAKQIIYMLIFGVISRIAAIFAQTFIAHYIERMEIYSSMRKVFRIVTGELIYAILTVAIMVGLMLILKNDGLTYNRAVTISVGFSSVGVILGTGISYIAKIANAISINDGSIYDVHSEQKVSKLIATMYDESLLTGITVAMGVLATMAVFALCFVVLLYGMAKDKLITMVATVFGCVATHKIIVDVLSEFKLNGVLCLLCIVNISVIYVCVAILRKFQMNERNIMIKPLSMQNRN